MEKRCHHLGDIPQGHRPYLVWTARYFKSSTFFRQPEDAKMGSVPWFILIRDRLLLSGYTIFLPGRVFREQRGGAAEILSRVRVDHGN